MNNKFNLKTKSYASIDNVFKKNEEAVNSTPILSGSVSVFRTKLKAIHDYGVPKASETVSITEYKADLLELVTLNASVESNAIILYADDHNLPVLKGKMPLRDSDLAKGTAEERLRLCQSIHGEASALGDLLLPYGCSSSLMEEMGSKLVELRTALSATRTAIEDRVGLNKGFDQCFKDMDRFLKNRLDKAVNTRAKDFPDFVKAYHDAKVLPKAGGRSSGEEEAATGAIEARELAPVVEQLQNALQSLQLAENGAAVEG